MSVDYDRLDFGEADAETEARNKDKSVLLTKGYFDPFGTADRVQAQEITVLLGAKGSGKSSILEHLRLQAGYDSFLRTIYVSDLPFSDFVKLKLGDSSPDTRSPTAWKFFLLSYLLESLAEDPQLELDNGAELVMEALRSLEKQGVRPGKNIRESVLHLSRLTAKIALPFSVADLEATIERRQTDRLFLGSAAEQLVRLAERTKSPSRHILFVDGLDEFFRPSAADQDEVIGGLVFAAHQLNRRFRDREAPCSVVVACRTEIFDRLPLSDTNRIKQTSGVTVDWSVNEDSPRDSLLFQLASHKPSAKLKSPIRDIVAEYFPLRIFVGKGNYSIDSYEFLLDRTRRIPRDVLRLLEYIRRATRPGHRLTEREVSIGAREYAKNYFLPEVRNELTSTSDKQASEAVLRSISQLDGHIFSKADLWPSLRQGIHQDIDLSSVLEAIFQAGAIGYSSRSGYYNFRYRNEAVGFNDRTELVLHNALITAFNIPRGRASR